MSIITWIPILPLMYFLIDLECGFVGPRVVGETDFVFVVVGVADEDFVYVHYEKKSEHGYYHCEGEVTVAVEIAGCWDMVVFFVEVDVEV